MRDIPKAVAKSALVLSAALALASPAAGQTPANWVGGTGNWTTAALWNPAVVPNNGTPPGSMYAATIGVAGSNVTLNSPITVNTLTLGNASATLTVSNTLSIVSNTTLTAGIIQLSGGTIMGGSVSSAGGVIQANSFSNTLDGVTVGANALDVSGNGTVLRLLNGTDFSALNTLAFGGGGYFRVEQSGTLSNLNLTLGTASTPSNASLQLFGPAAGGQNVTLASTVTITAFAGGTNNNVGRSNNFGDSGTNNLTNQGILQATAANVTLNINPSGIFTNAAGGQVIASNGGTVTLGTTNWVNQGTITVNAGTLNLTGDFAASGIGTVVRTGGTVNLLGTALGGTFDVQSFGGNVNLAGGRVMGGTLLSSGAARLVPNSNANNRLEGVMVGANALDVSGVGTVLRLLNGTDFSTLNTLAFGGGGYFRVEQSSTLSNLNLTLGTAAAPSNASLQLFGGQNVTLAPTVTITAFAGGTNNNVGRSNNFGDSGTNNLTNQGILQATAANVTLNINPSGTFTNAASGQVIASGTGTINMAPSGGWTNQGTFVVNAGTLNLNTDFATAGIGTVVRTGGTVNLLGTATGGTFDVQSFGGNVNLTGGRVMGGTLFSSGTARLVPNSNSNNRLDGVQVGANALDVSGVGTVLRLLNGADFSALNTLAFGGGGYFRVEQSSTLSNLNLTLGTAGTPSNASLQLFGGQNVTLASTVTITAIAGGTNNNVGRSNNFGDSGTNNLTNQGMLQATAANVTLNINLSGTFTNAASGQVIASGTGIINMAPIGGWTNQGTFVVNNGTLNLNTDFATAGIGTVTRTGGTINLSGTATGGTFDVQSFGGNVNLTGGRVMGGTLFSSGAARLVPNSNSNNRLDGVQVGANALDVSGVGTVLRLLNGTDFSALNTLAFGGGGYFRVEQSGTLSNLNLTLGTAGTPSNASLQLFAPAGGQNVTLASTVTITAIAGGTNNNVGRSNNFSDSGTNNLTNQGILQATAANVTLNINTSGTFTNAPGGQVIASGTGTINMAPAGGWTNQGTLVVNAGTLNLNTDFATAGIGTVNRTGGTVNLRATATTAAAGTFDVQSFGGNVNFQAGRIVGGALVSTGAARLVPNGDANNRLDGVIAGVNVLDMTAANTRLQLTGGTTFTGGPGAIVLGPSAILSMAQNSIIPSGISFDLGNSSTLSADLGNTATLGAATPSVVTVTVNPGPSASATIGAGLIGASNNSILVNQGTIQFGAASTNAALLVASSGTGSAVQNAGILAANVTGTTVSIGVATTFTNSGTLTAMGGTVNIPASSNFTNFNAGTLTGGTYQVFPSSVINFNGRVITTLAPGTAVLMDGASSVFTAANTVTTNNGSLTIGNGKPFTVNSGTLTNTGLLTVGTVQGDTSVFTGGITANAGSVIRGRGRMTGGITMASGATLAPGTSPGILTVGGAVAMTSGATFAIDLSGNTAGTGYSQLNLTGGGTVNLNNATLSISLNYAPGTSDTFDIITGGGVSNTFNNLSNGAVVDLGTFGGVNYKANIFYFPANVVISGVVPEPTHIMLFGALGLGAARWYRRRITSRSANSTQSH